MAWPHAGRYGPDNLIDRRGRPLPSSTSVLVTLPGDEDPVDLWTDRDRTVAAPNPFTIGADGNVEVYAEPGDYDLVVPGGRVGITVHPDPVDLAAGGGGTGDVTQADLTAAVAAEAGLRAAGDSAEAASRVAGDLVLASAVQELDDALGDEVAARIAGDGALAGEVAGVAADVVAEAVARAAAIAAEVTARNAAITSAIDALVDNAPGALDTLLELAQALQGQAAEIADLIALIGTKATPADVAAAVAAETTARNAAIAAEAALARNASNLTSGTVPEVRIPAAIARDAEVTSAVAAEAALARNASNLTSGTVPDARLSGAIARTSDARFTDQRVPTNGSVTPAKAAPSAIDPAAIVPGFRTLGRGETQAAPGQALAEAEEKLDDLLGDPGPGNVVYDPEQRETDELPHFPDGILGYGFDGGDPVVYAANSGTVATAEFATDSGFRLVGRGDEQIANLEPATRYAGGGPSFPWDGDEWMIYHGEEWDTPGPIPTGATKFWAFLGLAKRIAGVWTHVLRIVEPEADAVSRFADGQNTDVGGGPFTFHEVAPGELMLYVWHKDCDATTGQMTTLSVSSCNLTSTSAVGGLTNPGNWNKYDGDAWGPSGSNLGGHGGDLIADRLPGYTSWMDVAHLADGRVIAVFCNDNSSYAEPETSRWSVQHVVSDPHVWTQFEGPWYVDVPERHAEQLYASLVSGTRWTGRRDEISLADAALFVVESEGGGRGPNGAGGRWADAVARMRPFEIEGVVSLSSRVTVLETGGGPEVDPWTEVDPGAWSAPWADPAGGTSRIRYYRDRGRGHLIVPVVIDLDPPLESAGPDYVGKPLFVLPAGYRPLVHEPNVSFVAAMSGAASKPTFLGINSDGTVRLFGATDQMPLFMGGTFSFRIAP